MSGTSLSESLEMYLETIVRLEKREGAARVTDIARELGVSKPSVHVALHELESRSLAAHERYGAIVLTPEGRSAADEVSRRHGVLTAFLGDVLGVSAATAEQDACRIEHYLSAETVARIDAAVIAAKKPRAKRT
jgi:DtxR family transcriptional regulator, Mn-dependent transcriptional regulator